jgi:hypothetical protein
LPDIEVEAYHLPQRTTALIDRLVHHSEIISIEAESYRKREARPRPRRRPPRRAAGRSDHDRHVQNSALRGERQQPIAKVKLLRVPNVRRVVLDEEGLGRLLDASDAWLRPLSSSWPTTRACARRRS